MTIHNDAEFRRLLFAGHGRAVVHLQENGAAGLEEIILEACVRNTGFDRQCESPREAYLRKILALTGLEDALIHRIYEAARVADPIEDHGYDHAQQMALIALFAKEGNPGAKTLVGELFDRNCAMGSQTGSDEVVRLFGVEGYRRFLQNLVKHGLSEDDSWRPESVYDVACETCGKEAADSALAEYSHLLTADSHFDPAEEKYVPPPPKTGIGYAEYKERLYSGSPKPAPNSWGRTASHDELHAAAEDMLKVEDDRVLLLYLRIFFRVPFPQPEALVPILRKEDEKVVHAAFNALSLCTHPAVREAALEWIGDARWCHGAIGLLENSFQAGDEARIEHAMRVPRSDDILHWCVSSALDVAKKNPGDWGTLLCRIYDQTPCSVCRRSAIKLMMDRGHLTDGQRQEIRLDADDSIQELYFESSDITE